MLRTLILCLFCVVSSGCEVIEAENRIPVVVTTWAFTEAAEKAWEKLYHNGESALDAVQAGCAVCEYKQCDFTVGFGGSPDENGETTLDSMIMDGMTMNVGAVGGLRRIKNAVGVARKVLDTTSHSFLVGDAATKFAIDMGFTEENLTTPYSTEIHNNWVKKNCQPNYRMNVSPDPAENCGPYKPVESLSLTASDELKSENREGHDTIGMIAVDSKLRIASATSTNGAQYKIPGRVGDSPIPGSGSYADGTIGAAAATGDGDVMMRFLPSFYAVEEMKRGRHPEKAAEAAIERISLKYPNFKGAVITVRKDGAHGAACHGMESFPYVVGTGEEGKVILKHKKCLNEKLNV